MSEVERPVQPMLEPTLDNRDNRLGTLLADRYRVERPLGRGGMGTVYRGVQLSVNRPVAIKLISGPLTRNEDVVRRFRREAEAMAKLRHPNTVRLFEFGVSEEAGLFLVMELLEGCDLAQHILAHGALTVHEALLVARHALESLTEAHALGIVHRDLKPANIFLSQMHGGQVLARLTDFGIAAIQHAPASTKLTMTGEIMGSPGYMSPEQALGKPTDARSDLYSLGATLFEMLTSRPVFDSESTASLLLAHATQAPPTLKEARPEVTFDLPLEQLVQRLLEKQPEARPQTAEETLHLVDDLLRQLPEPAQSAVGTIPGLARTPTSRQHVQAVPIASATPQTHNPPPMAAGPESAQRAAYVPVQARRPRMPALFAALAALLLGFAVWKLLRAAGPAEALAVEPVAPTRDAPPVAAPATPQAPGAPEPQLRKVHIATSPRNASVLLQGVEIGKTPYDLQYRQDTTLTLSLSGYEPVTITVSAFTEPNLALDLVRSQDSARNKAAPKRTAAPEQAPPVAEAPAQPEPPAPGVALPAAPPLAAANSAAEVPTHPPVQRYLTRRERQQAMLNQGPPYRTVATAKRAFRAGQIDASFYDDVIWVLKTQRNRDIAAEKSNYHRALITRDEYERRVRRIKLSYEGE